MNVYFDCSFRAVRRDRWERASHQSRLKDVVRHVDELLQGLRAAGLNTLNYASKELPFDPYGSEIGDFTCIADAVLAVEMLPMAGFSAAAFKSALEHKKPMFLFIFHSSNALIERHEHFRFERHLFHDVRYPVSVVQVALQQP